MTENSCGRLRVSLLVLACGAALAGCGSLDLASRKVASVVTPYTMDVVQGNVVTREQVALLKPGMVREQVRDILGTALLTSVFHANRWDYVFTFKRQGAATQSRKVAVFFKDNAMERVESEDLPSESEFAATLNTKFSLKDPPSMEASPESLNAFPAAPKAPAPSVAPVATPSNYPPLESVAR